MWDSVSTGAPGEPMSTRPTSPWANIWARTCIAALSTADWGSARSCTSVASWWMLPGLRRSVPEVRAVTGSCTDPRSDRTKPTNPHWLQHVEQLGILALIGAVELRVGAHHRRDMGLGHRRLEGREVDLLEGPRGHHVVKTAPVGLLAVDGKVLGHGQCSGGLDALDVRHSHGRHQVGILAVTLVPPPVLGNPVDVEVGTLDHVDSLARAPRTPRLRRRRGRWRCRRRRRCPGEQGVG